MRACRSRFVLQRFDAVTAPDQASLLANSALFADLEPTALDFLADRATRVEYERGRTIFRQGDEGDTLYVIADGMVKVWVSSGEGGEMVLATLRAPDAFGELLGRRRAAPIRLRDDARADDAGRARPSHVARRRPSSPGVADGMMRGLGGPRPAHHRADL